MPALPETLTFEGCRKKNGEDPTEDWNWDDEFTHTKT